MANAHLLMQFRESASDETYELAKSFLQKTQTTMKNIVGPLSAGSPAVCILLASQRLNNDDFSEKATQKQSSLKPKDFKKLYFAIKNALEEEERSSVITYDALYDKYSTLKIWKKEFHRFVVEIENALMETGEKPDTTLLRCTSFFFLWNAVSAKQVPETLDYAAEHDIPAKLMSGAISKLRTSHPEIEKTIKAHSRKIQEKEKAKLGQISGASTPNPSPATRSAHEPEPQVTQTQPKASSSSIPTPTVPTPTRIQPTRHATRVAQLPAPSHPIWKHVPLRELPSRDSPKKRAPGEAPMDVDEEPSTPSKKRRTAQPEIIPQTIASPSRVLRTPAKKNQQILPPSALRSASPKKPAEVPVDDPLQLLATFEDEPDESQEKRRFRPVYLEHRLWLARDPRLTTNIR